MESKDKSTLLSEEKSKEKKEEATETKSDKKEETKAKETEPKKEVDKGIDDAADDDEEINPDELFKHRESINMTPENTRFSSSVGGLISVNIINAEGNEEFFERVVIRRSFPISAPDEFLSVREPDTRLKGRGSEIGMIRNINVFDKETIALLNSELELRYFTPEIKRIISSKEKFGYYYWEVETTAGHVSMVLNNPYSNIRVLEDGRIFVSDMDGNCFIIPDPAKLDRQSFKYIEIYI